jgi:hypothetical protein
MPDPFRDNPLALGTAERPLCGSRRPQRFSGESAGSMRINSIPTHTSSIHEH